MTHVLQSKLFVEGGVTKIRLTGGEPTLRRDIVDLTRELNALPGLQAIGITTNGIALRRKLPELQAHGTQLPWYPQPRFFTPPMLARVFFSKAGCACRLIIKFCLSLVVPAVYGCT